jgi:hypothetical protein
MRNCSARPSRGRTLVLTVAAAILVNCAGSGSTSTVQPAAQAAAQPAPASAYQVTPQTTLEDLVAPIALYPDDLLAILLPASAYPLDVVQANTCSRSSCPPPPTPSTSSRRTNSSTG